MQIVIAPHRDTYSLFLLHLTFHLPLALGTHHAIVPPEFHLLYSKGSHQHATPRLPPSMATGLTQTQLASWDTNGYLVIEDALDAQTVSALLKETHRMLDEDLDIKNHPMTRFSTGEGDKAHVGDDYFLTSGDKIRFFFEEGTFSCEGWGR